MTFVSTTYRPAGTHSAHLPLSAAWLMGSKQEQVIDNATGSLSL